MSKRIAIVPARGGSKRIQNKNIRNFCGRPMISYVLEAARSSRLFDVIHVSTECLAIKETVESLGFSVDFLRPECLAQDTTPIMPVLQYVVNAYRSLGQTFDEVWFLMACSPLLEAKDLVDASTFFNSSGGKSPVIAVAEYPVPIEWAMKRDENGVMIPLNPGMFAVRSQDFEKRYFDAGSFVAYPANDIFDAENAGSDMGKLGYIYPRDKVIDIDEEVDWKIAEALYMTRKEN